MAEPTASETIARMALKTCLEEEFASEEFPVYDDKLHGSIGMNGTEVGIYPVRSTPWSRDVYVLDAELMVQFYGEYNLEVNPTERVSPAVIEDYAERFRSALKNEVDPGTDKVWYFQLKDLKYPDDPTGNKTRFEAQLIARCRNTQYVETF